MATVATVADIRAKLQSADARQLSELERELEGDARKGVVAALKSARRRIEAESEAHARTERLYGFDAAALESCEGSVLVGLDEVGRGPVAGPLAVGAVVLPEHPRIEGLNDSKQVAPEVRKELSEQIRRVALACDVYFVEPGDIDTLGMAAALRVAFLGALARIEEAGVEPAVVLIDGNPLRIDPRERNVVKGDAKSASIAAASIIAKVARDELMCALDSTFPHYGFSRNKGYASAEHIDAIKAYGLTPVHRASFCKSFLQETLF